MMKIFSALAFAALMLWTASASAQSNITTSFFGSGMDLRAQCSRVAHTCRLQLAVALPRHIRLKP
jgi:hypothetical protein